MSRTLTKSEQLYGRARASIAGGVSSDARRMSPVPLFVDHASGSELWDVDGNRYLDYVLGQGPSLLGHAPSALQEAVTQQLARGVSFAAQHERESDVAERLCKMVPSAEKVRFNSVGSEAVHAALRLARGYTERSLVVKFEGHYHGWLDNVLFSVHPDLTHAGSHERPQPVPGSAGLTPHVEESLIILPFNDGDAFSELMAERGDEIAAVILEPILCNTGAISPVPGYLELLRELTQKHGTLLIFDEIITGFRVAPGGAQELLGVTPDLSVFGKAMAGGMQLSALAGRADVMDEISEGRVAHAGTFNSHPVSIAAAAVTLQVLDEERERIYPELRRRGTMLIDGFRARARARGVDLLVEGPGPLFQMYFTTEEAVLNYRDFAATDRQRMSQLHHALLERGVSMVPRGLWFLSTEHSDQDIDETLDAFDDALAVIKS